MRTSVLKTDRAVWLLSASVLLSLTSTVSVRAQSGQPPFSLNLGSVPTGAPSIDVRHLTLRDAINMALRYNLGVIEGGANNRAAYAERLRALSNLLPQVSAGISENTAQASRAALGITTPLIPGVIGPFSYSTVQASFSQTVLSVESIQRFRAARSAEEAASLTYDDTLDAVTLIVGNAYLQVIEAGSRIDATEAQVRNAQALYDQAVNALEAGTSPRIDATRTSVQLHTEQYNLSIARNNLAIAKLNLARAIGLPLGQPFDVADRVPYADLETEGLDEALRTAYSSRSDFRAALRSAEAARQRLAAARAERYPALAVSGDYGLQGSTFGRTDNVFAVVVAVNVPVFTGGRIESELIQTEASLQQRTAEGENLRGQIDYDVRAALLNLQAAREQVGVAAQNVELANESLDRSRERFAAGVTDSVEVVQAQQSVSSANDQYISGVYSHNLAKLQFARALGVARTSYSRYLAAQ
jgi:outer membrane protein TolC